MTTVTIGTAATTTLTGVLFQPALSSLAPAISESLIPPGFIAPADFATIDIGILDDLNPAHPLYGPMTGLTRDGRLYVPNRGFLQVRAGDYVAFDPQTGWPILISGRAAAN